MPIDQVHYINMKSRQDRRTLMEDMFERHGVQQLVQRFEAITPENDNDLVAPFMEKAQRLSSNEAACALSHFEVWKLIAKSGPGAVACIFEDDVRLMLTWKEQVAAAMAKLPEDWELLLLDCYYLAEPGWDFSNGGNANAKKWNRDQEVEVHKASSCSFADAYILTKESAEWCLKQVEECPWRNAEAILISLQERNKAFTTMPKVAIQRWQNSNIQNSGFVTGIQSFYKDTYFKYYPESLYEV